MFERVTLVQPLGHSPIACCPMDVDAVAVKGYHEVLALHRLLFESKMDDVTSVYAGSAFIAALSRGCATVGSRR